MNQDEPTIVEHSVVDGWPEVKITKTVYIEWSAIKAAGGPEAVERFIHAKVQEALQKRGLIS